MEVVKVMYLVLVAIILILFLIGSVLEITEEVKKIKNKKKWAAEQEEGRCQRKIKLSRCKTCKRKKDCTDYFGSECLYNSTWSCEGPAAPELSYSVEIVYKPGVTQEQKEDAIKWVQKIIWDKYNDVPIKIELREETEDWFCRSGTKK